MASLIRVKLGVTSTISKDTAKPLLGNLHRLAKTQYVESGFDCRAGTLGWPKCINFQTDLLCSQSLLKRPFCKRKYNESIPQTDQFHSSTKVARRLLIDSLVQYRCQEDVYSGLSG